jgi:hypothetical protein
MRSAFYFMTADRSALDNGYNVARGNASDILRFLQDEGFEIGLHPGYRTFRDPARLAVEKDRLDRILGETRYGGRQHFLRFEVPDTWRDWERVGLTYDSTMTFAEQEGFRCGTCHSYRPFDIEMDRALDIWEVPLIVMDGTLRRYRRLAPEQARARVLELARRCRDTEGIFTLLWHNSSLEGDWAAWSPIYEQLVNSLADLEGRGEDVPSRDSGPPLNTAVGVR